MRPFRPLGNDALVRLDEKVSYWDDGGQRLLQIPDAYKKQPLLGTVIAIGDGYRDEHGTMHASGLRIGDRVGLGPWNGKLVELGDEHEYRLCSGYNNDPDLQQPHVQAAISEPELLFVDVYFLVDNADGSPYQGKLSWQEIRAFKSRKPGSIRLRPVHDRVIVARHPRHEQSKGGLLIPATAREGRLEGIVVAVGNGRLRDGALCKPAVEVGDEVIFSAHGGTTVTVDSEEVLTLCDQDIFATVKR